MTADQSDQCAQALSKGRQQERTEGLAASFSMLNWNVEKAQHPDLVTAFAAYAERSDLIFLQEAVPLKKTETVIAQSLYEAFVTGLRAGRNRYGRAHPRAHAAPGALPFAGNGALAAHPQSDQRDPLPTGRERCVAPHHQPPRRELQFRGQGISCSTRGRG